MELTTKRRKETGAFYTPKVWAEMAVKYFRECLLGDLSDYIFWDCAGGEGALLEALPSNVRKIGTTLELEDMLIMKSKGIEAYVFDFLEGDFEQLPFWEEIKENPHRLVVFCNPPYMKLPAKSYVEMKALYPGANGDAERLFLYRICMEIEPKYLGIFTKAETIQKPGELYQDTAFLDFFRSGFATCSKQDWGLAGNFGILFSLFYFDWEQMNINNANKNYCLDEARGLFYTYWAESPHNVSITRTDIENLGQYVEKFHVYLG